MKLIFGMNVAMDNFYSMNNSNCFFWCGADSQTLEIGGDCGGTQSAALEEGIQSTSSSISILGQKVSGVLVEITSVILILDLGHFHVPLEIIEFTFSIKGPVKPWNLDMP